MLTPPIVLRSAAASRRLAGYHALVAEIASEPAPAPDRCAASSGVAPMLTALAMAARARGATLKACGWSRAEIDQHVAAEFDLSPATVAWVLLGLFEPRDRGPVAAAMLRQAA